MGAVGLQQAAESQAAEPVARRPPTAPSPTPRQRWSACTSGRSAVRRRATEERLVPIRVADELSTSLAQGGPTGKLIRRGAPSTSQVVQMCSIGRGPSGSPPRYQIDAQLMRLLDHRDKSPTTGRMRPRRDVRNR
jgi:hypothetical protein